jgi:hypothetical protein
MSLSEIICKDVILPDDSSFSCPFERATRLPDAKGSPLLVLGTEAILVEKDAL